MEHTEQVVPTGSPEPSSTPSSVDAWLRRVARVAEERIGEMVRNALRLARRSAIWRRRQIDYYINVYQAKNARLRNVAARQTYVRLSSGLGDVDLGGFALKFFRGAMQTDIGTTEVLVDEPLANEDVEWVDVEPTAFLDSYLNSSIFM